jgi:Flp pilus assembly protein TadD
MITLRPPTRAEGSMQTFLRAPSRSLRISAGVLLLSTALALGGCAKLNDVTGSIGSPSAEMPRTQEGARAYTEQWGKRYGENPTDKTTGLNYARGLRALTQYAQAVAVLQTLAIRHPSDLEIIGAYGKALADNGRLQEAAEVLQKAHTPDRPNWSILSSQGAVADQLGDHAGAQQFYLAALKITPGEPSVLSNLGLSYALSRQLTLAEQTLQSANASPRADARVRQNLALVLALQGKFNEAEQLARRDLSPADAAANVASIRQMIAQSNTWRQIQQQKPQAPAGQRVSVNR